MNHTHTNWNSRRAARKLCDWLASGLVLLAINFGGGTSLFAQDKPAAGEALVPLNLELPAPTFVGTPRDTPAGAAIEPISDKPRPPMMVPKDVKNLAPGATITSSDSNAPASTLSKITDGKKESTDENIVLLRKGVQYVQFDLGAPKQLFAIVIWHAFDTPKVYRAVIVQTAADADFSQDVRTLFNNDQDGNSKRGAGADRQYFETNEGKLINARGVTARYVRLYSHGSTDSALNEYIEVEIYGRPPK